MFRGLALSLSSSPTNVWAGCLLMSSPVGWLWTHSSWEACIPLDLDYLLVHSLDNNNYVNNSFLIFVLHAKYFVRSQSYELLAKNVIGWCVNDESTYWYYLLLYLGIRSATSSSLTDVWHFVVMCCDLIWLSFSLIVVGEIWTTPCLHLWSV